MSHDNNIDTSNCEYLLLDEISKCKSHNYQSVIHIFKDRVVHFEHCFVKMYVKS